MAFIRRVSHRHSKLGKRRKKKQVWRRPTGRDNKMREKRKGLPAVVSIGYGKKKEDRKEFVVVRNPKDLEKISKGKIVVVGNVGNKKKIEILKKAREKNISVSNINAKKFLEKAEKKVKKPEKVSEKKPEENKNKEVKKNESK